MELVVRTVAEMETVLNLEGSMVMSVVEGAAGCWKPAEADIVGRLIWLVSLSVKRGIEKDDEDRGLLAAADELVTVMSEDELLVELRMPAMEVLDDTTERLAPPLPPAAMLEMVTAD